MIEHKGGDALLNQDSARPILILIKPWVALSLAFQQGAQNRRPTQNGCICQVKHVVEAIHITLTDVIRERVTNLDRKSGLNNDGFASDLNLTKINRQV